jgi:TPP-dependent 2-oxoacid decarboxylase
VILSDESSKENLQKSSEKKKKLFSTSSDRNISKETTKNNTESFDNSLEKLKLKKTFSNSVNLEDILKQMTNSVNLNNNDSVTQFNPDKSASKNSGNNVEYSSFLRSIDEQTSNEGKTECETKTLTYTQIIYQFRLEVSVCLACLFFLVCYSLLKGGKGFKR